MPAIEVAGLTKVYRARRKGPGLLSAIRSLLRPERVDVEAVRDVSFSIDEGELVGFLGPNGAGKTTTLKILSGLLFPTRGEARVLGFVPAERRNAFRRSFALVMGQKNQLWWDLPAADSFLLQKEIYGVPEDRFRETVGSLAERLGVRDLLGRPVRELSLGERMKMELIGALLHDPRVLFLDEPTIGLDVVAQQSIRACIETVNRERRTTVILTSHALRDVEVLCRRVLVIHRGRLVYDGTLSGIRDRFSRHKLVTLRALPGSALPDDLPGAERVARRDGAVTFRVPREAVTAFCQEALRRTPLEDLSVEERPIEEVVAEYFAAETPP